MKKFGYSEIDTKTYVTLLAGGPLTGYEISKRSGIPRSKIYNALESLVRRGLILVNSDEQKRYTAIPIDEFLDTLQHSISHDLQTLSHALSQVQTAPEDTVLWKIADAQTLQHKMTHLIRQSKHTLLLQIWTDDLTPELISLLSDAAQRIEKFVLILFGELSSQQPLPFERYYTHGFTKEKLIDMNGRWINIVSDNTTVLFGSLSETFDVIWTHNPAIIALAKEYIKHDAYTLKVIEQDSTSLQQLFGPHLEKIREIY